MLLDLQFVLQISNFLIDELFAIVGHNSMGNVKPTYYALFSPVILARGFASTNIVKQSNCKNSKASAYSSFWQRTCKINFPLGKRPRARYHCEILGWLPLYIREALTLVRFLYKLERVFFKVGQQYPYLSTLYANASPLEWLPHILL